MLASSWAPYDGYMMSTTTAAKQVHNDDENHSFGVVLLVDDNDDLRATTADLLRGFEIEVLAARDGAAAGRLWRNADRVDALITDLRMPGEDGLKLAERLRRERGDLPVLLVSSHLDEGETQRLARGDIAYRPKPYSAEVLIAGLEEARRRAATPRSADPRAERRHGHGRSHGARWMLAVAALLATTIGFGLMMRANQAPALPDVETTAPRRSFRVEPLAPRGPQSISPDQLQWREVDGTHHYRVTLRRPGGDVMWEADTTRSPAKVPSSIALAPAVRYAWRIEALNQAGERIAWSETASFWLDPAQPEAKEDGT